MEGFKEAVVLLQDFEHHQDNRSSGHGAQRSRQQDKTAGNAAIPERQRGRDDIRIGKLEQAKADALHDEPGDPQGRRGLLCPRAEQNKTGANRYGTDDRQPLGGNVSPDEATADRRGQHRPCRGRSQDGAALGQRIAGDARQKIGHQQPDREGREIGQHADEIEQRKTRQPENFDGDDRTRRA